MSNKLVTLLIVLNILILIAFVWLIGALTGMSIKDGSLSSNAGILRERLHPSGVDIQPFGDASLPPPTVVYRTETYLPPPAAGGSAVAVTDQVDPYGRTGLGTGAGGTAAAPLPDLGPIMPVTTQDAAYVAALQIQKPTERSVRLTPKVDLEVAKTQKFKRTAAKDDHYNKVDVSATKHQAPADEATATAQKLELLALHSLEDAADKPEQSPEPKRDEGYLASLHTASRERLNESRTVVVERGDTLFEIAKRAYGDGFQYPKIFAANPHLTNPNLIEVGDVLRVPL